MYKRQDLKKAKERAHILEGLKKATDIVDELIATDVYKRQLLSPG